MTEQYVINKRKKIKAKKDKELQALIDNPTKGSFEHKLKVGHRYFIENVPAKKLAIGESKLYREDKIDLHRKTSKHKWKNIYRFDVRTAKMFKDSELNDLNIKLRAGRLCRKLLIKRTVNKEFGRPEFQL